MKKRCEVCGGSYEAQRSTSKYCSPRCRKIRFTSQSKVDEASGRAITFTQRVVSKTHEAVTGALQRTGHLEKTCKKCKSPVSGDRCLQKGCL